MKRSNKSIFDKKLNWIYISQKHDGQKMYTIPISPINSNLSGLCRK